ncbi:MAG TPA: hypothetical protein PLX89_07235 [Verrucomicrobiota bacterium]|nr:hypothetical protein [Verrucomicrobiota bacterium]
MAHHTNGDPSFAPLSHSRAEELESLINEGSRDDSVLLIDPDQGVEGVRSSKDMTGDDGLVGIRRFGVHFHLP